MRKRFSTQRLYSERSGCPLPSGTVSFAAGETQKTITINVAGDKLVEPNEGFTVTLSKPSVGTMISNPSASGTIINDDGSKQVGSQASTVTATGSGPTSGQMQFIPFNGGAGTGSVLWTIVLARPS